MKTLSMIAATTVLFFIITLNPALASAQQVAQDQPKEAIKTSNPEVKSLVKMIDVTGNWSWKIISMPRDSNEFTFDVKLTQDGEVVEGNFNCSNCVKIVNGAPVKGKWKDGKLQLDRKDLAFSGFELVPSQDGMGMTGTYTGRGNVQYKVEGKRK